MEQALLELSAKLDQSIALSQDALEKVKGLLAKEGWFNSLEEAETEFYKTHDPLSDDPDEENARVDRWVEDSGITIGNLK